ncbi:glycoside hydrolase superfamily [Ilyonectria sp. MPI-CAGE-AT-0026]|nr:glycoside hydrolase superfamily [Ilyonectria sp. MPI-CAGE-AT-0026]
MFQANDLVVTYSETTGHDQLVEDLPLPADFTWGVATAAYQIEGGVSQDGKGKSIWDTCTHLVPSRTNNENADTTCDHYNRMPEDVKLMKSLGVDVYRFSIAWSRVIPLGGRNDPINDKGIAFYNSLIDTLRAYGIEPVATLYYWDVPQGLYDCYGAFLNTEGFRADFAHYSRLCFSHFGDRVKKWITFNEPYIISIFAHHNGTLAPGRCAETGAATKTEPWSVGHTIILAHADVALRKGSILIILNGHYYEPDNADSEADRDAAQRRLEFYIGWFGDPVFLGKDYPASMRAYLGNRLPEFKPAELALLQITAPMNAFYGMNHYSTKYARALQVPPALDDWTGNIEESSVNSQGQEIRPVSGFHWLRMAPEGFRKLIKWVWNRYQLPVVVTENGCPCPGESDVEVAVDDKYRQRYFGLYLDAISRAIYEDGVRVKGYYVWSLLDNFGISPVHLHLS